MPNRETIIIANPIYDVIFKILMENLEIAREVLGAITGLSIIKVDLLSQEHSRKDDQGKIRTLRLDFCALVATATGDSYQIIIELQKENLRGNVLRFRRYLASTYANPSKVVVDGETLTTTLPVISIYLLGFELSESLPTVVEVRRYYRDLINEKTIDREVHVHPFIEQLTHDSYFIQIPKITGKTDTRIETVLSIFDQSRKIDGDKHRMEVDATGAKQNQFLNLVFRVLERLQADLEMDKLMSLEDTFLLEQQMEADAVRIELKKERKAKEALQRRWEEEQQRREEEQQRREEEQQKREVAERKLKELQDQLDQIQENE